MSKITNLGVENIGGANEIVAPRALPRNDAVTGTSFDSTPNNSTPNLDLSAFGLPENFNTKPLLKTTPIENISFARSPRAPDLQVRPLQMDGVPSGYLATNPSAPVMLADGRVIMAVREQLHPDLLPKDMSPPGPSQVGLYQADPPFSFEHAKFHRTETLLTSGRVWHEDPFLSVIDGQLFLGAVAVRFKEEKNDNGHRIMERYATSIYRLGEQGDAVIEKVAEGPADMKDVRLFQLQDGRIGLLTRPKGGDFGNGYVGFATIDKIEDLTAEVVLNAPAIFRPKDVVGAIPALRAYWPDVWVGGNDAVVNGNGSVTVYGHFGTKGPYGAIRFSFDPPLRDSNRPKNVRNVQLLVHPEELLGFPKEPVREITAFTGGCLRVGGFDIVPFGWGDSYVGLMKMRS